MHAHTYIHTYIHLHTYSHKHIGGSAGSDGRGEGTKGNLRDVRYTHTPTPPHIHTHTCEITCEHTYTHTNTHTHTHTNTDTRTGIGQAVVKLPKDRDDFRVLLLLPSTFSTFLALNFSHESET
jgi:hypothetical protein